MPLNGGEERRRLGPRQVEPCVTQAYGAAELGVLFCTASRKYSGRVRAARGAYGLVTGRLRGSFVRVCYRCARRQVPARCHASHAVFVSVGRVVHAACRVWDAAGTRGYAYGAIGEVSHGVRPRQRRASSHWRRPLCSRTPSSTPEPSWIPGSSRSTHSSHAGPHANGGLSGAARRRATRRSTWRRNEAHASRSESGAWNGLDTVST